jgi:hypothetical protein
MWAVQDYWKAVWIYRCRVAVKNGKKSWNCAKVMLMGQGRCGKTCLGRTLTGKLFEDTPSTTAMDASIVNIDISTSITGGNWYVRRQPASVLEEAVGAAARAAATTSFPLANDILLESLEMLNGSPLLPVTAVASVGLKPIVDSRRTQAA